MRTVVLALTLAGCRAQSRLPCGALPPDTVTVEWLELLGRDQLELINADRAFFVEESKGAAPLRWSDALFEVAICHAADMCRKQYFDHVSPQGEGWVERIDRWAGQELGSDYYAVAENLAYVQDDDLWPGAGDVALAEGLTRRVHIGLMDECVCDQGCDSGKQAGHRRTILDPELEEVGIGVWYCPTDDAFYVVQDFWRSAPITPTEDPYCPPGRTADPPSPVSLAAG